MILQSVTHHIETNTLEAVFVEPKLGLEGEVVAFERVKCQSYSTEQRAAFIADTAAPHYADMAGWPE